MKTVEQTNKYLSSCLFEDDEWSKVLDFCRKQYGGGHIHRPKHGKIKISFADFLMWHNHMFGQGDIVTYGNIVGIVGKCTPSECFLAAYTGLNEELIQKDFPVFQHKLKLATKEQNSGFNKLMSDEGVYYSVRLGQMVGVYVPEDGEFVLIKTNRKQISGIFNRVEDKSFVFYYVENYDDEIVPVTMKISDCSLERLSQAKSLEMLAEFSYMGVMWDARNKQFLDVPKRATNGGKYWYINDKFYVCQAKDVYTPVHKERYNNGNYFTSYGAALVFLKRLKDLRAELEKGSDS